MARCFDVFFFHLAREVEVKLTEKEKNRKLNDLLDALEFNQVHFGADRVNFTSV